MLSRAVKVVSMMTRKDTWVRTSFWTVVYGFLLASQQLLNWPLVRFWNASQGSVTSADARSVLKGLECYHQFEVQGFFSPEILAVCQSSNIYGTTFGFFSTLFGITAESTLIFTWVGIFGVAIVFGYCQSFLFGAQKKMLIWIFPFLALSPPVHFLLERANFDTLVFFLIFLGSFQVFKSRLRFAAVLFAISALLKFYSIFSVGALLAYVRTRLQFWTIVAIQISLGLALTFELLVRRESTGLIPSEGGGSFGLTVLPLIWNIGVERLGLPGPIPLGALALLGIAVFLPYLVAVVILQGRTRFLSSGDVKSQKDEPFGVFGLVTGVVFISCFLAGANFDYRMIFLIPFGVWILSKLMSNTWYYKVLTASLIGSTWISFVPGPLQPLGDLLISVWAAVAIVGVIEELKLVYRRFVSKYPDTSER